MNSEGDMGWWTGCSCCKGYTLGLPHREGAEFRSPSSDFLHDILISYFQCFHGVQKSKL